MRPRRQSDDTRPRAPVILASFRARCSGYLLLFLSRFLLSRHSEADRIRPLLSEVMNVSALTVDSDGEPRCHCPPSLPSHVDLRPGRSTEATLADQQHVVGTRLNTSRSMALPHR